jgi:hypothetical protein
MRVWCGDERTSVQPVLFRLDAIASARERVCDAWGTVKETSDIAAHTVESEPLGGEANFNFLFLVYSVDMEYLVLSKPLMH